MQNHSNNSNNNTKKLPSYKEIILQIAEVVCNPPDNDTDNVNGKNENNPKKFKLPRCAKYEKKVAEYINKFCELSGDSAYKSRNVHSSVQRALKKLVEEKKFVCFGDFFYPATAKYRHMFYTTKIKEKVRFAKNEILKISDRACVVTLEKPSKFYTNYCEEEIIGLFTLFIGKENCYAVRIFDDILVIMLEDNNTNDKTTIKDIAILVDNVFSNQKPIIKLKRKQLTNSRYRDKMPLEGGDYMPVLSRFYGIIIRMYFLQKEHNPPHIHAIYGEDVAAITISDGAVLEGALPAKALELVKEWVVIHKEELMDMWETQEFKQLSPLE